MADRYWVGGGSSANWNATGDTNWGTASNTQDDASVPGASDAVIFDGVGTGDSASTMSADITVASLDFTGYTNTLTQNAAVDLIVAGNCTFVSGMTYTLGSATTSTIKISATGNFDPGGQTFGQWNLSNSGTVTLTGNFTSAAQVYQSLGTADFNGYDVTCNNMRVYGSSSKTLNMGEGTITLTNDGEAWYQDNYVSTVNEETSHVIFSGNGASMGGSMDANIFYDVSITGSGNFVWKSTQLSLHDLTRTGTAVKTDGISIPANTTISGTFTVNGNSGVNRVLVYSNILGIARTITAGTVVVTNADFQDIIGAGGGSWNLSVVTGGSGDCGGNTDITFTTADDWYWNGSGTQNFSDYTYWYTATNGGGSQMASTRPPLPQDTCYFDGNSIDGATTVDQDMPRIPGIDFTGVDAMSFHTNNVDQIIYGSFILGSNVTVTSDYVNDIYFEGRGSFVIDTLGKPTGNSFRIRAVGGTYTLLSDCKCNHIFSPTHGTFDANDFDVLGNRFSFNHTTLRTIYMGSGTWINIVSNFIVNSTNLTLYCETSTLQHDEINEWGGEIDLDGETFYNITLPTSVNATTILGSSTLNVLTIGAPKTVKFTSGTTQTITSLVATGTSENGIIITSTSEALHYLADTTGTNTVSYCTISWSSPVGSGGAGGALWDASDGTNTDGGDNTVYNVVTNEGWRFTSAGVSRRTRMMLGIGL